jgi:alpha-1,3-glucan synthase
LYVVVVVPGGMVTHICPAPSGISSVHYDGTVEGATAFNTHEYTGPLMNRDPASDGVVMSRLQVALQREIGGWPLYTIILALGQVSYCAFLV